MLTRIKIKDSRRHSRTSPFELDQMLVDFAEIASRLTEQHLICSGYIRRQGAWQRVSRLNRALTSEERNLIRRHKRKAQSVCVSPFLDNFKNSGSNLDHYPVTMLTVNSDITEIESFAGRTLNDQEVEQVRDLLKADPELYRYYGQLHNLIRHSALDYLEPNSVEEISVYDGIRRMRLSLLSEGSSPLEVIAIDQIVNNHIQVLRSGHELENFEPNEENQAAAKHWLRVHNAAQARLIKAVNWLNRLRKLKVDEVIRRKENKSINFASEFAKSLKKIDEQFKVLERLESGEELTDEELGIEQKPTKVPSDRRPFVTENMFHPDFSFQEESESELEDVGTNERQPNRLN